jgi:hypothetical protein
VGRAMLVIRPAAAGMAALAIVACNDLTAPLANSAYVLKTVDGHPLPAVIDSTRMPGFNRDVRILGRTLEFLGPDSVQYAEANDIVEPLPDGNLMVWASDCLSVRASYTLAGRRLIVKIDLNLLQPVGSPPLPIRYDTLTTFLGDSLVHDRGARRFSFTPGRLEVPICAGP